jgi:hypothetical protein
MQCTDVLSAARTLGAAMAHATRALGEEGCERAQRRALTNVVGGVTPLGLSAAQMSAIAERLEIEACAAEVAPAAA